MKRIVAAAPLLFVAGCVGRPSPPPGPVTPPPPIGRPVTPPPPQTVTADSFALRGEITQGGLLRGTAPTGTSLLLLDGKAVRFAADGRFVIAFDRDQGPSALLEARLADGRLLRLPIAVSPRAWDISSLPTLQRGTSPSPEFQRIRSAALIWATSAERIR